jgi:hypothetical protein
MSDELDGGDGGGDDDDDDEELKVMVMDGWCCVDVVDLYFEAHFRWGPGSKFKGTNVDSFEANWLLELEPTLDTSLHLGSSNHKLFFFFFFFFFGVVWTNWCYLQNGAM